MADPTKSQAEIDVAALEKYNKIRKAEQEREARMWRHYNWRGNKLPPMNIEPMRYERWRLAGEGMTETERAMRKQWVMDQRLAPHEPVHIPELKPRNPFRRFFGKPWELFFNAAKPIIGERYAVGGRVVVPRFLMSVGAAWAFVYYVVHQPQTWEDNKGWHIYPSKPELVPGDPGFGIVPIKENDEFNDKSFKKSTLYSANVKTSAATE